MAGKLLKLKFVLSCVFLHNRE